VPLHPEPGPPPFDPRRVAPARQQRLREWPLAVVLLGVAAGVATVVAGAFEPGGVVMGAALLLGAVLRAALPQRRAGLLAVRSRPVDVVTLGLMGVGLVALALIVPPQPV
jgi:hypothetical protein